MNQNFLTTITSSFIVLLATCSYNPEGRSIYFIDSNKQTCRERKVIQKKPLKFQYIQELPLDYCNGYISVKPKDFKEVQSHWDNSDG